MKKPDKQRRTELLKLYPDGDAIGRVIVEDYLNIERYHHGVLNNSIPVLSDSEIAFLIGTIQPEDERQIYNRWVDFRDAIYYLANMVSCLDNLFFCGYFGVLQLIKPAETAFEACSFAPSLTKDERFKARCSIIFDYIEDGLLRAWDNVKNGLHGLILYDVILEVIGEVYKFDFSVIRPDLKKRTKMFMELQEDVISLSNYLSEYEAITKWQRGKVKEAINAVINSKLDEIKLPDETRSTVFAFTQNSDVSITTLHSITGRMTRRR